jgi:hypothetical protein
MTQLSPHFSLSEMIQSSTAVRKGIDNTPNAEQTASLKALCINVLEPVRAHYNKSVKITSGFRCARLNKAVGGSSTSQHCFGQAADFSVEGVSNFVVCQWIVANLSFDQVIYEFGESGWVHCSFDATPRKSILSAKKVSGRTKYLNGLVK